MRSDADRRPPKTSMRSAQPVAELEAGPGDQAVRVVDPEPAVLPRPGDDGLLATQPGEARLVILGVENVRRHPHRVDEADAGQERCTAAKEVGVLAREPHAPGPALAGRPRPGVTILVPSTREGTGVEEVELDVVDPEVAQRTQRGLEMLSRRGVCDVQTAQ